jgi:hypothetical protein
MRLLNIFDSDWYEMGHVAIYKNRECLNVVQCETVLVAALPGKRRLS